MFGAATSTRLYFHIPFEIVSCKEKLLGAFGREITGWYVCTAGDKIKKNEMGWACGAYG